MAAPNSWRIMGLPNFSLGCLRQFLIMLIILFKSETTKNPEKANCTKIKTDCVGESRVKTMLMYRALPMYLPTGSKKFFVIRLVTKNNLS